MHTLSTNMKTKFCTSFKNRKKIMTMYIYCIYTEIACLQLIVKFTHRKAKILEILVEFYIRCLQHVQCLTNVYYTLLYIIHWVPGDFIHLVNV